MDAATLSLLLAQCAPLVHPATAIALIAVESSGNPHAIGVVGGRLDRQPSNRAEALVTARALHSAGWRYSVGLAQITDANFPRLGLDVTTALDPCRNLAAMQTVLTGCLPTAAHVSQADLRRTLSCYYSGNPRTGFRHGYVQRVVAASTQTTTTNPPEESRP